MDIFSAVESRFISLIDKYAFEINSTVRNQFSDGSIDRLERAIKNYNINLANLETTKQLRLQLENNVEPKVDEG
jgi:hypothetical protein